MGLGYSRLKMRLRQLTAYYILVEVCPNQGLPASNYEPFQIASLETTVFRN